MQTRGASFRMDDTFGRPKTPTRRGLFGRRKKASHNDDFLGSCHSQDGNSLCYSAASSVVSSDTEDSTGLTAEERNLVHKKNYGLNGIMIKKGNSCSDRSMVTSATNVSSSNSVKNHLTDTECSVLDGLTLVPSIAR